MRVAHRVHVLIVAAFFLAVLQVRPATAQESQLNDLVTAFRTSVEASPSLAAISLRVRSLAKVVEVDGWKRDLKEIADILDEAAKPDVSDKLVTRLFDKVAFYRSMGRPERMLPALQALRVLRADDARVLFAMGEAFGVASDVFDAARSKDAFEACSRLLETKMSRPKGPRKQADELIKFLPELSGDFDASQWLRGRILGFLEVLESGQPIGLWKLRDARMEELREDLIVQRTKGSQRGIVDVLKAILQVNPGDPGAHYMLGELRASLGPEFNPPESQKCYERFLELTAESRFEQAPGSESPIMSREDVASSMRKLLIAGGRDDLQAMRVHAKSVIDDIRTQGKKFTPLMIYPDLSELATEHDELVRSIGEHEAEITKLEKQVREAELARERVRNERDRKMRETKKGFFDPEPYNDRISGYGATIKKNQPKVVEHRKQLAEKLEKLPVISSARRQAEQDAAEVSSRRNR